MAAQQGTAVFSGGGSLTAKMRGAWYTTALFLGAGGLSIPQPLQQFLDRCIINATSTGTGDFVQASAVTGYQTVAAAGGLDGRMMRYSAQSSDLSQWEVGFGLWQAAQVTLTRTQVLDNSLGTTAKINFASVPQVMVGCGLAEDETIVVSSPIGSPEVVTGGGANNILYDTGGFVGESSGLTFNPATQQFAYSLLPGDVLKAAGTPAVALHSLARKLLSSYTGALFQVRRNSDGVTLDIGTNSAGWVDYVTLLNFLGPTTTATSSPAGTTLGGTITQIYDQSGNNNILPQATVANQATVTIRYTQSGRPVVVAPCNVSGTQFYRNRSSTTGIPVGASPITVYMINTNRALSHIGSYGNMESTVANNGTGHMFAIAINSDNGVGVDWENGVWYGGGPTPGSASVPITNTGQAADFRFGISKTDGTSQWVIKGGTASSPVLNTLFSGALPQGVTAHFEGGISMGEGGDGTPSSVEFVEGVIVAAMISDNAGQCIQNNLAQGFGQAGAFLQHPDVLYTSESIQVVGNTIQIGNSSNVSGPVVAGLYLSDSTGSGSTGPQIVINSPGNLAIGLGSFDTSFHSGAENLCIAQAVGIGSAWDFTQTCNLYLPSGKLGIGAVNNGGTVNNFIQSTFNNNNSIDLGGPFGGGSVNNITFSINGGFGGGGNLIVADQGIYNAQDILFITQPNFSGSVTGATIFEDGGNGMYCGTSSTGSINFIQNRNGVGAAAAIRLDYNNKNANAWTFYAGVFPTSFNGGTQSSGTYTVNAASGNYQYITNGGAFTIAAPAVDSAVDILVTNNASAGTISFSGFTVGSTGDALTTTNNSKFLISVRRINAVSTYVIKALQ